MKSLPIAIRNASNQLDSQGTWLMLLTIVLGKDTIYETTLRIANDLSDVSYGGDTYTRFPFNVEPVTESLKGELPRLRIVLGNAERSLNVYLYNDNYKGGIGAEITLRVVYKSYAGVVTATGIEEIFTVLEVTADEANVALTVGITQPLTRRFPRDRYMASICRHIFKGGLCRYTGAESTCDHSLVRCLELSNTAKFGGSPGASEGIE